MAAIAIRDASFETPRLSFCGFVTLRMLYFILRNRHDRQSIGSVVADDVR